MPKIKYHDGDYVGKYGNILLIKRTKKNPKTRHWYGLFKCPYDGTIFESEIPAVTDGRVISCGCLPPASAKNLIGQTFGRLTVICDSGKRAKDGRIIWKCQCSNDGNIVEVSSKFLLNGSVNSCGCLVSIGEEKLQKILTEIGIKYERQKTFKDLKNPKTNRALKFDFYLPDYNCCIEYDGKSHYESNGGWNTEENFQKVKYRDSIKNSYCEKNNILLIRIPYFDLDNIDKQYLKERIPLIDE